MSSSVRKLIVGLICLAAIAVLIDFCSAAYAEYRVSRALRIGADLTSDPDVTFHGFPFIAQALDGTYRNVEIRAREVQPGVPGDMYVHATIRDVKMPLHRLADGTVRHVAAGQVDGGIWIDGTELGKQLGIRDLQVSSLPADRSDGSDGSGGSGMTTAGAVVLMGTVPVSSPPSSTMDRIVAQRGSIKEVDGVAMERVSVTAQLTLENDHVRIQATDLYSGRGPEPDTPVSAQDLPGVLARFTRIVDYPRLPFGLEATKVYGHGGQIVIEGTRPNMTVALDQLQRPSLR